MAMILRAESKLKPVPFKGRAINPKNHEKDLLASVLQAQRNAEKIEPTFGWKF